MRSVSEYELVCHEAGRYSTLIFFSVAISNMGRQVFFRFFALLGNGGLMRQAAMAYYELNLSIKQGRIYVANEYPTFARAILIVCHKITISRQNFFE